MKPDQILNEADRCVKCGLCLPHCPTYRLTRDESDSPRGRIALIQALVGGCVDSPALHNHLDQCLSCLACQSACPSGVRYGPLIDAVRATQPQHRSAGKRLLYRLLTRVPYFPGIRPAARAYRRSPVRQLLRRISGSAFRRLDDLLPEYNLPTQEWRETYAPRSLPSRGRVGLFTGCIGRLTDQPALVAAIQALTAMGLEVVVPHNQVCCGALHLHNGLPETAAKYAETNCRQFNGLALQAIIYVASGCGVQLLDYPRLGAQLEPRVTDICSFLTHSRLLGPESFTPLAKRVLLHIPCTQRTAPGGSGDVLSLLKLVPRLETRALSETGCCGAAGSYLLSQPAMADRLAQTVIESIGNDVADLLLTSNTGCALQLGANLRRNGIDLQVKHPIELIAQQLAAPLTAARPSSGDPV